MGETAHRLPPSFPLPPSLPSQAHISTLKGLAPQKAMDVLKRAQVSYQNKKKKGYTWRSRPQGKLKAVNDLTSPLLTLPPSLSPSLPLQLQAVCFDVDSTVCAEEGIDILAEFLGQGQAVADLTAK